MDKYTSEMKYCGILIFKINDDFMIDQKQYFTVQQ